MNRTVTISVAMATALFFALATGAKGWGSVRFVQDSVAWSPSSDCSICHAKYVQSIKNDKLLMSTHAKAGASQCTSCHEEDALKQSHANVTGPSPMMKARRYPKEFCLRCHGTLEDLAKKTATSKVLTDTKGRTINPHNLPKTPAHAKAGDCANCHRMHKSPVDALNYCFGCHHKREFACNECHSEKG
jgi:hypothetical protein